MKMIASTKLAKAQRAMQAGKEYGLANSGEFLQLHPSRCIHPSTLPTLYVISNSPTLPLHRGLPTRTRRRSRQTQTLHRRFLRQGSLRWYPLLRLKGDPPRVRRAGDRPCLAHRRRRRQVQGPALPHALQEPRHDLQPDRPWRPHLRWRRWRRRPHHQVGCRVRQRRHRLQQVRFCPLVRVRHRRGWDRGGA